MKYYIADLHFYHEALLKEMDYRPFQTLEEMHDFMIKAWNEKVNKRDEVYILGDVSYGTAVETNEILEKLNGKLYLIRGNHDNRFLKKSEFRLERFEWVKDYYEGNDNKRKVILSHYPLLCYNGQYRTNEAGVPKTFMLYGHVHDSHDQRLVEEFVRITRERVIFDREGKEKQIPCNLLNCFCMYSDYKPLSLDEWLEFWRKNENR